MFYTFRGIVLKDNGKHLLRLIPSQLPSQSMISYQRNDKLW